jgi:hypothetical protein
MEEFGELKDAFRPDERLPARSVEDEEALLRGKL